MPPGCADGSKNGAETDVDCGGPSCPACALGMTCHSGSDCESGVCQGGICVPCALQASAGPGYTCAVLGGGSIRCWGANDYGQLGDASTSASPTPVEVQPLPGPVVQISTGGAHACAVADSGALYCWGWNAYGQLGDGSEQDSSVPIEIGGLPAATVEVATGWGHTCALLGTGEVHCWGLGSFGQLGNGGTGDSPVPVAVSGLPAEAVHVAAGNEHACAVLGTGEIYCWGLGDTGQLGNGGTGDSAVPVTVIGLPAGAKAITAGGGHSCAVLGSGAAYCWGYGGLGQLGDGTYGLSAVPVAVQGLPAGVAGISAGSDHTCAVLVSGPVYCWGNGTQGALGNGGTASLNTPAMIGTLPATATQVAAGGDHSCALLGSSSLFCWGAGNHGQLGNGGMESSGTPVRVEELCP